MYIRGEGIEIGGLNNRLKTPKIASVKYVDILTADELCKRYPELGVKSLPKVDIIDDGERLDTIADSTQDFVIANHFLEHCQNPIDTITNMLRVLRPNGIAFLSVPDKRYTFDVKRGVTAFEHVMKDYTDGPEWSKEQHWIDHVRFLEGIEDEKELTDRVKYLVNSDLNTHFHVWTANEIVEMFVMARNRLNLSFEIEMFYQNEQYESIVILRKLEKREAQLAEQGIPDAD
jgi:predicted SAM-dependent methyltransferase